MMEKNVRLVALQTSHLYDARALQAIASKTHLVPKYVARGVSGFQEATFNGRVTAGPRSGKTMSQGQARVMPVIDIDAIFSADDLAKMED